MTQVGQVRRGDPVSGFWARQRQIHLRDVLGDQIYESLARRGETMTTAEMMAYAFDQIDQARTEVNVVSKHTKSESLEN